MLAMLVTIRSQIIHYVPLSVSLSLSLSLTHTHTHTHAHTHTHTHTQTHTHRHTHTHTHTRHTCMRCMSTQSSILATKVILAIHTYSQLTSHLSVHSVAMRATTCTLFTHLHGAEQPGIVLHRIQPHHDPLSNAECQEEESVPDTLPQKDRSQEIEET